MNGVSLEFEASDLAGWLWLAVAALAGAEGLRYVVGGHRPGAWWQRGALAGAAGAAVAGLKIGGWVALDARSHGWACLWLGGLGVLWLARAYRRTTRTISRRVRLTLLGLRVSAGGVVLLLAAGPVLQSVHVRRERAVLGILLDDSRSMTVRDVVEREGERPISRIEALEAMLSRNRSALKRLAGELEVRWFAFDAEVRETSSPSLEGKGSFTALADAVGQVHLLHL